MNCAVCGQKELFPGRIHFTYNKKPICPTCLKEHTLKCDICGRIERDVKWQEVNFDNKTLTVCDNCFRTIGNCQLCNTPIHTKVNRWGKTPYCSKCGPYETFQDYITHEYHSRTEMKEVMDGPFKVNVSNSTYFNPKYFRICSMCQSRTIRKPGDPSDMEDEDFICATCIPNVRTCMCCGDRFLKRNSSRFHFTTEDKFIFDNKDITLKEAENYCRKCSLESIKDYHANHREMLRFYYIENKKTKIFEVPFGSEVNRKDLFMGFELEVQGVGEVPEEQVRACAIRVMEELGHDLISITRDGSVSNGFEIITAPATLEWYEQAWDQTYRKMCNILRRYGLRSHDPGTCGLHVHVSKKAIQDLGKLVRFIHWFIPELVVFSRRKSMAYCAPSGWGSNILRCSFNQFLNWNPDTEGHSVAFNTNNGATAEFRIFRGTLNQQTLLATLQFVNGFVKYANTHSEEVLPRITWEEILDSIPGKDLKAYASTLNFHKYDPYFKRTKNSFETFNIVSQVGLLPDTKETL